VNARDPQQVNDSAPFHGPEIDKNSSLHIGTLNVCGILSKLKFPDFSDLINNYDVFVCTECKIADYDIIELDGYTCFTQARKQKFFRRSGGISVFVKLSVACNIEIVESECDYIMWIKFKSPSLSIEQDVLLGAVYVPPETSRFYNKDELCLLENEVNDMCNISDYVLLTGDFNGHTGTADEFTVSDDFLNSLFGMADDSDTDLNHLNLLYNNQNFAPHRTSVDTRVNSIGNTIVELCRNNELYILNGRFSDDKSTGKSTFKTNSVIDYTICSAKLLAHLHKFTISDVEQLLSDGHAVLSVSLNLDYTGVTAGTAMPSSSQPPKWRPESSNDFVQNINHAMVSDINNMLNLFPRSFPVQQNAIDGITNKLSQLFRDSANMTFPRVDRPSRSNHVNNSSNTRNSKPWYGHRCRNARTTYNRARKRYKITKSISDRQALNSASKSYKRTMNYHINQYKFNQANKLRGISQRDPKAYWNFLKRLNVNKSSSSPTLNELHDYLKTCSNVESSDAANIVDPNIDNDDDILNSPILPEEIEKMICNCKNGKASCRSDFICNEYIKSTQHILLPTYTQLFNIVLDTGVIPSSWSEGYIIPIFKNKGSPSQPENYRPITILSCLGKLFTSVLNARLTEFTKHYEVINESQAGFRAEYSTTDHIFTLHTLFELLRARKQKLFVGFLDFSRAFDSVPRTELFQKLFDSNVQGKFLRVVQNMYQSIKSCVQHKGDISAFFACNRGVRQGESLSPLLFSFYLNDLLNYLNSRGNNGVKIEYQTDELVTYFNIVVLLFADDTVLLSNSAVEFQKCLDDFNVYSNLWSLEINPSKSKVVVFGSSKRGWHHFNFKLGDNTLEIVDNYKYLGVVFSQNGSFLKARSHLVVQAKKAMFLLYKRIFNLDLPIDLQLKLFDHTVLPILTYSCEVWGFENLDMIEAVHLEFLRKITNSKKSTPAYILYGELGRHPIEIIIKSRMVNFWSKIVSGSETKYAHVVYCALRATYPTKWLNFIRNVFDSTGQTHIFLNQTHTNTIGVHRIIKNILHDQFLQLWRSKSECSSKAKLYSIFKDTLELERYFTLLPKHQYLQLFKFRSGNHKFPIEQGRWTKVPYDMRKCTLCHEDIGDEYHYLMTCKHFENKRKQYIKRYYYTRPNTMKYKELLNSNNAIELKNLSSFVTILNNSVK